MAAVIPLRQTSFSAKRVKSASLSLALGQIDLKAGAFHVARRKKWLALNASAPRLRLRALRSWKPQQDEMAPYVFTSLRGGPLTNRTIHFVVAAAGKAAGIKFPVHPHMLRHATGFYLANTG